MVGKIFITSSGYDPQAGKHVKDPYLGDQPTLGACRPDVRRQLKIGDHIFIISGKVPDLKQYVLGGFEIESKISAVEAYDLLPQHRLVLRQDGQLSGNIIVDADGKQHRLDNHKIANRRAFDRRISNYVIGKDLISLSTEDEIKEGRDQTMEALSDILRRKGNSPFELVGHYGRNLSETQVQELRAWLCSLKQS